MPGGRRYTFHIEGPRDDPAQLVEDFGALASRGYRIDCPALDGQMRRSRRDEYLRKAHALMTGTTWTRCVQLEAEVRRFEGVIWPQWRDRETPPRDARHSGDTSSKPAGWASCRPPRGSF